MKAATGFTLIELMTVIVIIMILVGLVIRGGRYALQKANRNRAQAEIAALEMALENYKADNGVYPVSSATKSDNVSNSGSLLASIIGGSKRYFAFTKSQTQSVTGVACIVDPFGKPYNYWYPSPPTNTTYTLWSYGPDGLDNNGTNDDITASKN